MHKLSSFANQRHVIITAAGRFERELPSQCSRVGESSLAWGRAEEIGSPAYWCAQTWAWEIEAPQHYQLGHSLEEEVLACILGGHGMPAEVGLAAYRRLRDEMHNCPGILHDPAEVLALLSRPLHINGRSVRYRFANQRSSRIAGALSGLWRIDREAPDRKLRDELTTLPGIGLKTASWIVRNWRDSDDVSILDVHILRAGRALGVFRKEWTIERHYCQMEAAYLEFASNIGARASILDSVMWMTMRQLPWVASTRSVRT